MDIIGPLFKSKIRQKILIRFFADEGRKYYINEMARLAGTSQGTCRRELNKLADMGLLVSSRTGNLQYYEINRKYPLYNEFRTIIQKTIGIEGIIKERLQELKGVVFAFIFGSYVKNEFKPESDIDILIIGTISEDRLVKLLRNVEGLIGREINYHIYSVQEFKSKLKTNSFIKNIIKHYKIVAGDDGDFKSILEETGI
jgi:predicted nucleotidyltransferase